ASNGPGQARPLVPTRNIMWPDLYLRQCMRYFGQPYDVEIYRQDDGSSLRLATFDHGYRNYRIYASLGLSEHAGELKDLGEVILLADDPGKDIPFLFVNALFFIRANGIALGSHFAIGGIDALKPDFAEHFQKHALYLTLADGFPRGFEKIERGQIGLVFQALFISGAEHDLLSRKGWQELEERLKAQDADPCSLRRPSLA